MQNLANANFSHNQKSHYARTPSTYNSHVHNMVSLINNFRSPIPKKKISYLEYLYVPGIYDNVSRMLKRISFRNVNTNVLSCFYAPAQYADSK